MWYEQEKTPRVKIEYVETKKDAEEPEKEVETTESSDSASEAEESKNLEGTGSISNSASDTLSETY